MSPRFEAFLPAIAAFGAAYFTSNSSSCSRRRVPLAGSAGGEAPSPNGSQPTIRNRGLKFLPSDTDSSKTTGDRPI